MSVLDNCYNFVEGYFSYSFKFDREALAQTALQILKKNRLRFLYGSASFVWTKVSHESIFLRLIRALITEDMTDEVNNEVYH